MAEERNKWFRFNATGFPEGGSVGAHIDFLAPNIKILRKILAKRMIDTSLRNFVGGSIDIVEVSLEGDTPRETAILKRRVLSVDRFVEEVKKTEYFEGLMEENLNVQNSRRRVLVGP